jgi:L-asparaginase II
VTTAGAASRALDSAGAVELAALERSGMVESRHLGAAALVDRTGSVIRSLGDTSALIYPRSALKPLQAIAVLRSGAPLRGVALVLAAASHAGSREHLAVVRSILDDAGLDEDALQCPVAWPFGREYANDLIRAGRRPTRAHMNCSGKHAAFLLACVHNGWSTQSYLDPSHPVQELVRETIAEFADEPIQHSGTDGCGAPVHALTLAGLARATGRVTAGKSQEAARLTAAILADPWAIDGRGRANTVVIEKLGFIGKLGAEGVLVLGAPTGEAAAVKILDGSARAATMVALELLVQARVVTRDAAAPVLEATTERVLGGSLPAGRLRVSF